MAIAALILAIGASAMFSVALSSRLQLDTLSTRERMQQQARLLSDRLRVYVAGMDSAGVVDVKTGRPGASWVLPGDLSTWALTDGFHDVTGMLPADLSDAPDSGKLGYTVTTDPNKGKKIVIEMKWNTE